MRKISKALKDTGGASSEYQDAILELNSLGNVLQHLAALEPTETTITHVNAIRRMALACQIPLKEFLDRIEKFEKPLGPFTNARFKAVPAKARWAVLTSDELRKLRAVVAGKLASINALLSLSHMYVTAPTDAYISVES